MTADDLIEEGRRLARPCVYLRPRGEAYAAIWGGEGIVPAGEGPFRHWLTVDCGRLPPGTGPTSGCLSIYTNEEDSDDGQVAVDRAMTLPRPRGRTKLYAHPGVSLPPIDAVFRSGSRKVGKWLAEHGRERDSEYDGVFPDAAPVEAYDRAYQAQLPLFAKGAYAVLGGWHMPWPEGDWSELLDGRLIAWTLEDSEPWVEAWRLGRGYRVIERMT